MIIQCFKKQTVGGFVGLVDTGKSVSITNGLVQNLIAESTNSAGGFVGTVGYAILSNCTLTVSNDSMINTIKGNTYAAGLIANGGTCNISDCKVKNINITLATTSFNGGSAMGIASSVYINNFQLNSTTVNNVVNGGSGICGQATNFYCTNCSISNLDLLSSSVSNVGGAIGNAQINTNITNFRLTNTLGLTNRFYGVDSVGGVGGNLNYFNLVRGLVEKTSCFGT